MTVNSKTNMSVFADGRSTLPPLLNAYEVYTVSGALTDGTNSDAVTGLVELQKNFYVLRKWSGDPCLPSSFSWEWLECNSDASPRVTTFNLGSFGLSGPLPDFSYMTELETIDLHNNSLSGAIPNFLGLLPKLKLLNLADNGFSGTIPKSLSQNKNSILIYNVTGAGQSLKPVMTARHSSKPKLIIGVSGAIGLLLLFITICCSKIKSLRQRIALCKTSQVDQNIEAFIRNHSSRALTRYKFSDVKKMTNSFKDKLGEGGYGYVYQGKLPNDRLVAVKLLKASQENGEDFINEVASISGTSHVNVVTLLGFCSEGRKKALIYEFMSNGSLDKFINNNADKNSLHLTWENLYQIAIGIARGLEYLHRGCNTRILHFDIKPHNILLDESFCPKISDFGLAKLCSKMESIISISQARGTIEYLAPEVWNGDQGGVSHKSDIYSYGMMLLDMAGARKNMNVETNCSADKYFPNYIYVQLEQGRNLGCNGAINTDEKDIARRPTIVGLWCVQTFPSQRPTMSKVIEMLERRLELLETPPKPVMPSPPSIDLESSTTTNTTAEILGFQSSSHSLMEEH